MAFAIEINTRRLDRRQTGHRFQDLNTDTASDFGALAEGGSMGRRKLGAKEEKSPLGAPSAVSPGTSRAELESLKAEVKELRQALEELRRAKGKA